MTAPRPLRAISRADLTLAIVNGVIGSAIFGMPAQIAALTGAQSPLAHLIAALGVLTIVLCFAEVASRFEDSGGAYLYSREAFGRHVGFQAGWLTLWTRLLSAAANLNVFASYLSQILPAAGAGAGRSAVIIGVLVIITVINLIGVKQASWTVDVFTIAKLLPLALLVLLGLPNVSAEVIQTQAVAEPQWTQAVLLLIFAFGGFEAPLMSAGEAKDARKDSAFALLVALGIIATVYISVQYVTIGLVPNLQQEKAPIAAAFSILWGPAGVTFASFAAMISVWGWATGNGLQSPRLLFSMAERGELPGVFARVHARFLTPHVAIVGFSVVAGVLAIVGTFEGNAVLSAIVRLIVYALVCISLWVFRRTKGPAQFQVPFALPVSILALGFCFYMLSTRSFAQAGIILAAMAAGHVLMLAQPRTR
ncbi:MAG TPA: APC family permease [Vicinamibacteria bacterium]|nr:APC family permease [Vicinamibacteria bacterium]